MIRTGNIGNTDSVENIQLVLREDEITADPQSIELLDTSSDTVDYARSEAITKDKFYYKPVEYTASETFKRLDYTKEGMEQGHGTGLQDRGLSTTATGTTHSVQHRRATEPGNECDNDKRSDMGCQQEQ